ncbi:MAG: N-acetylmuramic acid 6-phosphate etherase [Verrucomicrobia bacterium]|nr:MAG: N-acetylmuramic acid 6-phosphate etherase [Verrucomicrobiota bacterium]
MPTAQSGAASPPVLGIECGGTHTVAIASNGVPGNEIRIDAGPCNLRLVSDSALEAHFESIARRLPPPAAVGVGMAGVRDRADCRRVEAVLARVWPTVPCLVDHDLESALAAAESDADDALRARVIILSGTGSCCYGRGSGGRTAKVGGWGHQLGDRGSGYDIVHRALRAAAHHVDHTGRWPRFGALVLGRLLLNEPNDLIGWLQKAGKAEVAALAPLVFSAAAERDPVARRVAAESAALLADDAAACARRLGARGRGLAFVLAGSVLLKQPGFAAAIARRLRKTFPGCRVQPLGRESVWGAVVMARRALAAAGTPAPGIARTAPWTVPPPSAVPLLPDATGISPTEQRHPGSTRLDRMPVADAIDLMLSEDARIPGLLRGHSGEMARLVKTVASCFKAGGRLFYVGAGTSGRLGVLDASECPPTFRTPPEWVQGIIAGGFTALHAAVEGAEDDIEAGARAVAGRGIGDKDVVLGIAASGRTPFVWGALRAARERGARTALLCFNPHLRFRPGTRPNLVLAIDLGPEILTGSTRLKAGTATKLVLNIVTTLAMVRLGKVIGNLMVDLNASNAKLRDRAVRIVVELTGRPRDEAESALEKQGWIVAEAVRSLGRR